MSMPWYEAVLRMLFVTVTVPLTLFSVPPDWLLRATLDRLAAPAGSPLPWRVLFVSVKLTTPVPSMPLPDVFSTLMLLKEGPRVLVREMPWLVVFWMGPPEA